jgi:hypothetical protein
VYTGAVQEEDDGPIHKHTPPKKGTQIEINTRDTLVGKNSAGKDSGVTIMEPTNMTQEHTHAHASTKSRGGEEDLDSCVAIIEPPGTSQINTHTHASTKDSGNKTDGRTRTKANELANNIYASGKNNKNAKNGAIDKRFGGKSLGCWVMRQRQKRSSGELDSEQIRMLDDVGFVWNGRVSALYMCVYIYIYIYMYIYIICTCMCVHSHV